MKKQVTFLTVFIFVLFLIVFFDKIVGFIVNIEWFKEVGYLSIYFTKVVAILKLMVPIFLICFIGIWLYYRSLRSSINKWKGIVDLDTSRRTIERRIFFSLNFIISFIIAYVFSSTYWYRILQFDHSVSFNVKDPIFGKDVSFYIFKLPLIESLYQIVVVLLVFLIIITFITYFFISSFNRFSSSGQSKGMDNVKFFKNGITRFAGRQLAILSSLIMLCLSLGYLIRAWNLVYSPRGVTFGASYTDVNVSMRFYYVIAIVSLFASIIIFISLLYSKWKPIVISILAIVALIVGETASSFTVENFIVKSNQKTLEQPYIKYNIDFTRKAFNIDTIKEVPFDAKNDLTVNDLNDNKDTISNIRINSYTPALEFFNQVQSIKYYYGFNDIDIDRYKVNGKYSQFFVSAREVNTKAIDPSTWQNIHLIYTHGYGVVMSKVNSVTSEGQPDYVIKDIPPENNTDISLENPRIYYGESTDDYAVVKTNISEFDYPKDGEVVKNQYNGTAGLSMSFANKLLFTEYYKNFNFLLSRDISSQSRILINRNIVDRVKKIAPFLTYDKDPYIVVSNGRLYWMMDAYTTSDRYPFSQYDNNINYIRNSIKVVVDALNGNTDFYIVDKNDPIAASYSQIFKGLFKDGSSMPQGLKDHIKYPEDLFNIQCRVLGKYHMTDPNVFFDGGDLWEVSQNQKQVEGERAINEAPYVVMRLPGESQEEMILTEYFNVRDKESMAAIFGARMDKDNYGKLILYRLPSQMTTPSPYMFNQKLKQDTAISQALTLWDKNGSQVLFGDTLIVPIKNSLLYVEPMYLRASGKNSIPEVKRIIMSYGDKIVLAESVENALQQLFNYNNQQNTQTGASNTKTAGGQENISSEKVKTVKELYDKAIEAQKNGDWASYGDYIKKLGDIINDLNK